MDLIYLALSSHSPESLCFIETILLSGLCELCARQRTINIFYCHIYNATSLSMAMPAAGVSAFMVVAAAGVPTLMVVMVALEVCAE